MFLLKFTYLGHPQISLSTMISSFFFFFVGSISSCPEIRIRSKRFFRKLATQFGVRLTGRGDAETITLEFSFQNVCIWGAKTSFALDQEETFLVAISKCSLHLYSALSLCISTFIYKVYDVINFNPLSGSLRVSLRRVCFCKHE